MNAITAATQGVQDYASLSTPELCDRIARLCEAERLAEWAGCQLLAELADRFDRRVLGLGAFADVHHFSRLRFGMSIRRARERVRVGRALRTLPALSRAFVDGRLGYARVREVTRVAKPADEARWLALALDLP